MTKRSQLKLIIFDYDGVLVDSLPVQFEIYRHLVAEMGLDPALLKEGSGDFFSVDYRETLKIMGVHTREGIREAEVRYLEHIKKLKPKIHPFPFISDLLEKLKDYKLAIVSNNNCEEISKVLESFGLREHFDMLIGPPTHNILKPEPDQLLACLKDSGVEASEAIYVGDMDGDIDAAKAAGIESVGVAWGFHSKPKLLNADHMVDNVEELLALINPKAFKEETASDEK